ncbi:MAG TPA: hypothetical protein VFG39_01485 [Balneolaceae bacterium]|nr:hypothetical protein [Balneolaceae bacterium]
MAFIDFIGDWITNTSKVPAQLRNLASELENDLIETSQDLQDELSDSGQAAAKNLRKSKFASLGAKAGLWLSEPANMLLTVAGVIGAIFLVLSVSKKT